MTLLQNVYFSKLEFRRMDKEKKRNKDSNILCDVTLHYLISKRSYETGMVTTIIYINKKSDNI